MIGIVDYGLGNILSVYHALEMVGADIKVCPDPESLTGIDRIVLPGVGAFRDCMANLVERGFVEVLEKAVLKQGKPILGICLGMQAMARRSFEGGEYQGLGWIDGDVVGLEPRDPSMRVPHIGWNDIQYRTNSQLFEGLPGSPDFYFVHSYHLNCDDQDDVDAICDYGGPVTAAVRRGNIFATQFHPEKSQDYGLKILENFLKWDPAC
ncbi:imidazole glycerol phosphate synthase subunit HisH [Thermodesulfobacteriota bacterium]